MLFKSFLILLLSASLVVAYILYQDFYVLPKKMQDKLKKKKGKSSDIKNPVTKTGMKNY